MKVGACPRRGGTSAPVLFLPPFTYHADGIGTCHPSVQYYFETLFPRIPKPVQDDLAAKLTAMGLPVKAIGNAGQGGGDRRGVDEPNRRPASVKVRASGCGVHP